MPEDQQLPIRPAACDFTRKINAAAWTMWKEEYRSTALDRGWTITTCTGRKGAKFPHLPYHLAGVMSRLRVNRWRTIHTAATCCCGSPVSFLHCLFQCAVLADHFKQLRSLCGDSREPLRSIILQDDDDERLLQAAKLIVSSEVAAYL